MLTRRDWLKSLAALAAGAAALPQQLLVFEQMYERNATVLPAVGSCLSIKDITFGFYGAPRDAVLLVSLYDNKRVLLQTPLNYRATFRFAPSPDHPFLTTVANFRWEIGEYSVNPADLPGDDFYGTVSALDESLLLRTYTMRGASGTL